MVYRSALEVLKDLALVELTQEKQAQNSEIPQKYSKLTDQLYKELNDLTAFITLNGTNGVSTKEINAKYSGRLSPELIRERLNWLVQGDVIYAEEQKCQGFMAKMYFLKV